MMSTFQVYICHGRRLKCHIIIIRMTPNNLMFPEKKLVIGSKSTSSLTYMDSNCPTINLLTCQALNKTLKELLAFQALEAFRQCLGYVALHNWRRRGHQELFHANYLSYNGTIQQ